MGMEERRASRWGRENSKAPAQRSASVWLGSVEPPSRRAATTAASRVPGDRVFIPVIANARPDRFGDALLVGASRAAGARRVAFEMKAVSTSIDGMSGDFSTTKPA